MSELSSVLYPLLVYNVRNHQGSDIHERKYCVNQMLMTTQWSEGFRCIVNPRKSKIRLTHTNIRPVIPLWKEDLFPPYHVMVPAISNYLLKFCQDLSITHQIINLQFNGKP